MLNENQKKLLDQLVITLDQNQIIWLNGYFSGLINRELKIDQSKSQINFANNLTIIYITETGNSKFLASEIHKKFKEIGVNTKLKSSEQYKYQEFSKEQNVILIISTHGDGEIPASGKSLSHYLSSNPDLSSVNYLVLALGDKNYPLFCQAGKDIDLKLEQLNAKKILSITELDLNFDQQINEIFNQIKNKLFDDYKSKIPENHQQINPKILINKEFYIGKIINNINLNDVNSSKETRHIEIAVDEEFYYEPGDSIGIILDNSQLKIEGKITPRLYSISSSPNEHSREVHLTVSVVRYLDQFNNEVHGLFSNYLAKLKINESIKFYLSKNRNFKLPQDHQDIIMIGAGTGIAPFRSFIAERNYRNASGKNWLFFGERNFISDFLYQTELQEYFESGLLTKIDLAFSRDSSSKIYVWHRLIENSKELFSWLENNAYLYICGDKNNMARDVENALLEIISKEGNKSNNQAKDYLNNLIELGRYNKDIY